MRGFLGTNSYVIRNSSRRFKELTYLSRHTMGGNLDFTGPLFKFIEPELTIISDGRVVDTSAIGRYSAVTKGWNVHRRSGEQEKRYCVTTRKDGVIDTEITAGFNGRTTLKVSVN